MWYKRRALWETKMRATEQNIVVIFGFHVVCNQLGDSKYHLHVEEKKCAEFIKRQCEQNRIERRQRRRQHPLYVSRFDEKRYVPSMRKKFYKLDD